MRVVIDAVPLDGEGLPATVLEHLLESWQNLDTRDEIHLIVSPRTPLTVPAGVAVHEVGTGHPLRSRLRAQNVTIPRICRAIDADILFAAKTPTTFVPLPCPKSVLVYDLRHKLRPEGLTRRTRLRRTLADAIGFRQFDSAAVISQRTLDDLLRFFPRLRKRPVRVIRLGADHADDWGRSLPAAPYAVACVTAAEKNVDLVVDAWALRHSRGDSSFPLAVVGLPIDQQPRVEERITRLGLTGFVTLVSSDTEETFASAGLVVFPSDFEAFGLPAAEAMRLGIPLVISADLALLETTNGYATVMDAPTPEALVRAVDVARCVSSDELEDGRRFAARYNWADFAKSTRWLLAETVAGTAVPLREHERAGGLRRRRALPAFRWVGAAIAGALAVSGLSAASIALVSSGRPSNHPTVTTQAPTVRTSPHSQGSSPTGTVPMPPPSSVPGSSTSSSSSSTSSSSPSTSTSAGQSTTSTLPPTTGPGVTVPITLPTITIPLPSLLCSLGSSALNLPLRPCISSSTTTSTAG